MITKMLACVAAAAVALAALPAESDAAGKRQKRNPRIVERDCKPVNGPFGYYGNPWCDGGFKQAEDYAPGEGGYFDVFDLPQVRRLQRGWWD